MEKISKFILKYQLLDASSWAQMQTLVLQAAPMLSANKDNLHLAFVLKHPLPPARKWVAHRAFRWLKDYATHLRAVHKA